MDDRAHIKSRTLKHLNFHMQPIYAIQNDQFTLLPKTDKIAQCCWCCTFLCNASMHIRSQKTFS